MSCEGNSPGLILASGSPRRKELLDQLGVDFAAVKPQLDESDYLIGRYGERVDGVEAAVKVEQLARAKAEKVGLSHGEQLILAADTMVVSEDGRQLGKPSDLTEAAVMLSSLAGGEHRVHTGVCLLDSSQGSGQWLSKCTRVKMKDFDRQAIANYTDTGEPMGKAGAYAIQQRGGLLVCGIEGSYSNVVGLPIECLDELFCSLGYSIWDYML